MIHDTALVHPKAKIHETVQVGPYSVVEDGVEIRDRVVYSIPFGFIGQILNYLWIRKNLENIFKHRKKVIDKLFENNDYKSYTSDSIMEK